MLILWPALVPLLVLLLNTALRPEKSNKMEKFGLITEVLERCREKNPISEPPMEHK